MRKLIILRAIRRIFSRSSTHRRVVACLLSTLMLWLSPAPVAAAQAVDLELVLAVDVSTSINRREYALQMRGLAQAFRNPDVVQTIQTSAPNGIAVCLLQWAGEGEQGQVVDWRLVRDAASAEAMAAAIDAALRIRARGGTAIGDAIRTASGLFEGNGYDGQRRIIDVSGDGRANQGIDTRAVRNGTIARDITINGLAILNEEPALDLYYDANVIGGSQAFVLSANDFKDFARAIRSKLIREIGGAQVARGPGEMWPPLRRLARRPQVLLGVWKRSAVFREEARIRFAPATRRIPRDVPDFAVWSVLEGFSAPR